MKRVYKILIILSFIFISLAGFTSQETTTDPSEDNFHEIVTELKESTVSIMIYNMEFRLGIGSGMIFDKEQTTKDTYYYYVVTNQHVVDDATHVKIQTNNGNIEIGDVYAPAITGASGSEDIAVVRFESKEEYKVIELPKNTNILNPLRLTIGQKVFGIGTPVDIKYANNVSDIGIVTKQTTNFIIHTANINPGNSGGPLFTMDGTFVGINTQRLELIDGEIVEGIAESIIVDKVVSLINERLSSVTPKLGINVSNHDNFLRADYSIFGDQAKGFDPYKLIPLNKSGIVVIDVGSTRPSYNKLQVYDLIESVNGKIVKNLEELTPALGTLTYGSTYQFGVYRLNKDTQVFEYHIVDVTL